MCRRRAGAAAGGGRRAAGPGGSGLARQRPLFGLPLLRPLQGQALGGPPREAGGVLATGAPGSRPGPGTLLSGSREAPTGRQPGSVPRAGVSAPRPSGESWRRRSRARGWLGPCFHGPSLSPPPSGFRGLRTEGRESGTRAPYSRGAALGLKPRGSVTGRGNFPKPKPEPEHPPPPPLPLIPLPLHLLLALPLPPTRILPCLTDGAVSQWKVGTDLPCIGEPMVGARGRKGAGFLPTSQG